MKPKTRKLLVTLTIWLVALFSLIVLVLVHEAWSGARAWNEARAYLEAEGETLALAKLRPEQVSDSENFCATPLITSLTDFEAVPAKSDSPFLVDVDLVYHQPDTRDRLLAMELPAKSNGRPIQLASWASGRRADLNALAARLEESDDYQTDPTLPPPERVLAAFARFEDEFRELENAARRPHAQLPDPLTDDFAANISVALPYLSELIQIAKFQSARAAAALGSDRNAEARDAVLLISRLGEAGKSQQMLLSHMIHVAISQILLDAIWEGIPTQAWTEGDLVVLEELLQKVDLRDSALQAMRCEMVLFQIGGADFLKSFNPVGKRQVLSATMNRDIWYLVAASSAGGIWDHNKAYSTRFTYDNAIRPLKEGTFRPDQEPIIEKTRNPRRLFANLLLPATHSILSKTAETITGLHLARIGCAVERYRLQKGSYPDQLEDLVPEFFEALPTDYYHGSQAFHYLRSKDGETYRIYSPGEDGDDDRGEIVFRSSGARNKKEGDWVWSNEVRIASDQTSN